MRKYLILILIFISIFFFCSSCSEPKYENNNVQITEFDFGDGTYRPNPFRFLDNLPPFSWMGMPDSVKKETNIEISFNEDAVRSHAKAQLIFVDQNGNKINGIKFGKTGSDKFDIVARSKVDTIPVLITVDPIVGDSILHGTIIAIGNELDQVNDTILTSHPTQVASWSLTHKKGINWWRWLILICVIVVILAAIAGILYLIFKLSIIVISVIQSVKFIPFASKTSNRGIDNINNKTNKRKKKSKKDKKNRKVEKLLRLEKKLYSNLKLCEKYDVLEEMRLILDTIYQEDLEIYNLARQELKENTWDALEESWTLWNPVPSSHVEWTGPGKRICNLKATHKTFEECSKYDFTQCKYDEHGSPDFSKVTFPGTVVDISDLYDSLSVSDIKKRGGSSYSLQEVAQMRMAEKLRPVIEKWAKENNQDADFWKWRDAHDLVPHEDTNCRTMRLVYRTPHTVFKHRGGVANAINIKSHF